jgi:tetratricopeptide (TPR) repeat protein
MPDFLPLSLAPGDGALQAAIYLTAAAAGLLAMLVLMGGKSRGTAVGLIQLLIWVVFGQGLLWHLSTQGPALEIISVDLANTLRGLTFVNSNHQAGLLNVGFALALGQAALTDGREQLRFGTLALVLAPMALGTASRGGAISLVLILALTMLKRPISRLASRVNPADRLMAEQRVILTIGAAILLMGALFFYPLLEREFGAFRGVSSEPKLQIWAQLGSIISDAPVLGIGPSGVPVLHGMASTGSHVRVDYIENFAVQRVVDWGPVPALVWLSLLAWIVYRSWQGSSANRPGSAVLLVAWLGLLVHNLVDFSLELLGGLLPFALLAAGQERLAEAPQEVVKTVTFRRRRARRNILVGSAIALSGAAITAFALAPGRLARGVDANFLATAPKDWPKLIATNHLTDGHAYYRLGRHLAEQRSHRAALGPLNHSVFLRPASTQARLFRLAVALELGESAVAETDLAWLLARDQEVRKRTLGICRAVPKTAEPALIEVLSRFPASSYAIGATLAQDDPAMVERIALALRNKFPEKRLGIEALRGEMYLARGLLDPAHWISAALLANPETEELGLVLEGQILLRQGKFWLAFHAFREVCDRQPTHGTACYGAMQAAVAANRPAETLRWLQSRTPYTLTSHAVSAGHHAGLARVYLQLGRLDEAVEAARTANSHVAGNREIGLLLCEVLLRSSLHAEAREQAELLLRTHPNDAAVQAMIKRIEEQASPLSLRRLREGLTNTDALGSDPAVPPAGSLSPTAP